MLAIFFPSIGEILSIFAPPPLHLPLKTPVLSSLNASFSKTDCIAIFVSGNVAGSGLSLRPRPQRLCRAPDENGSNDHRNAMSARRDRTDLSKISRGYRHQADRTPATNRDR